MAKRAKGFKKWSKAKNSQTLKKKGMKRLHENLNKNPLFKDYEKVVSEPQGEIKMSGVLWKFIEPYKPMATDLTSYHTLFDLAIMAWNLTLSDNFDLDQIIESMSNRTIFEEVTDEKQVLKGFIEELIARKNEHFAEYKQVIVDFDVQAGGGEINLSVAFALPDDC